MVPVSQPSFSSEGRESCKREFGGIFFPRGGDNQIKLFVAPDVAGRLKTIRNPLAKGAQTVHLEHGRVFTDNDGRASGLFHVSASSDCTVSL